MLPTTKRVCEKCGKTVTILEKYASEFNLCLDCKGYFDKNKPTEIVIKPEALDLSNVAEGEGSQEFRPATFEQYIGQEDAKEKAQKFIGGCKRFNEPYPHTFISASAGMGKSLFATILANQLNKKIIFTTGGELKSEQMFVDKMTESDGGIIFIDEANRLSKKVGFFILPLIEQFTLHGQNLKRFSCFFATTHMGDISKDLDALISRCDCINLRQYTHQELLQIITQYNKKQYNINISNDVLNDIVLNCRQTPRLAKNLVRAFAYVQDWNKVKKFNNIVLDGLNKQDIKSLEYLNQYEGVGKNSIANYLRIKPQTYEWEIEPYLIYKNLITVSNKRKITQEGKNLLERIKKCQ